MDIQHGNNGAYMGVGGGGGIQASQGCSVRLFAGSDDFCAGLPKEACVEGYHVRLGLPELYIVTSPREMEGK
jgi:hypothetical protein